MGFPIERALGRAECPLRNRVSLQVRLPTETTKDSRMAPVTQTHPKETAGEFEAVS